MIPRKLCSASYQLFFLSLLELQQRLYLLVEFMPLSNQKFGQFIPLLLCKFGHCC
jgi:hypothetical protein